MRWPAYPKYKDSGVDWLGEVPEGWVIAPLKWHASLRTEKTERHLSYAVALENIESWTGKYIETESEYESNGTLFFSGDVLFGKLRPYLAKAFLAPIDGEAVGDFHVIAPTNRIRPEFLQHQLLTKSVIDIIDGSTFGAKMPRASWEFIGSLPIAIPPITEQDEISLFLSQNLERIDALIAEQENLITLLQEKRQAVISHAVTKGLNPDAPMKDSGMEWLGEVPTHWSHRKIGYCTTMSGGSTPNKANASYWDGTIPWVSPKDMKKRYIFDSEDHITESAINESGIRLYDPPVVLIVIRGMILAHSFPVAITEKPLTINQDMKVIQGNSEIMTEYLAFILEGLSSFIVANVEDSAHGTKCLRADFGSLSIFSSPTNLNKQKYARTYTNK